jgi:hypothetical protein
MRYYVQVLTRDSMTAGFISEASLPVDDFSEELRLTAEEMQTVARFTADFIGDLLKAPDRKKTPTWPTVGPQTPFGHGLLP